MPEEQNVPIDISEELKKFAENDNSENDKSKKLIELLQANLEHNEEVLKISREIKKYIRLQNVWATLRTILIVAPIVLGFIYLPPFIKEAIEYYKSFLRQ